MFKIISLVFLMLLLAACTPDAVSSQSIEVDGASVSVQFISTKRAEPGGHGSLVFGKLVISGEEKIQTANLDCFTLSWNGHESERIYVDSVASIMTNSFPGKNGVVIANVYWILPNVSLSQQDLFEVRIKKSEGFTRCISYF